MENREVFVWLSSKNEDMLVGKLWFHYRNGRESASFEYDKKWLKNPDHFALEPALQLTEGATHTAAGKHLFGAIEDSAPDRWGRVLMRRAAKAAGVSGTLMEADYLLGVNDEARLGALRFSEKIGGEFLAASNVTAIPPFVDLPKLLNATNKFLENSETANDLRFLLAPGSSLGGARPKATVRDKNGELAIAKFPRKDDEFKVEMWEATALSLAEKSRINVPKWRLEMILDKPVLIMKRFDRNKSERLPFLSAMSMLDAKDGDARSYIEIADALAIYGSAPDVDMPQLWRRMVFNILVSNTDDHLRNHGFLYEKKNGWRLSPAYDLNPVPQEIKPRVLETAITFDDFTADIDAALSVAKYFQLTQQDAKNIVGEVAAITRNWRNTAKTIGLNNRDIERMASAFEHKDLENAIKMSSSIL
ncbi:phosphatidylinositol kinase [Synergistales bacterium]|nr:phosphatidylinositol kinase [Synergistales bacterium]